MSSPGIGPTGPDQPKTTTTEPTTQPAGAQELAPEEEIGPTGPQSNKLGIGPTSPDNP